MCEKLNKRLATEQEKNHILDIIMNTQKKHAIKMTDKTILKDASFSCLVFLYILGDYDKLVDLLFQNRPNHVMLYSFLLVTGEERREGKTF